MRERDADGLEHIADLSCDMGAGGNDLAILSMVAC
jgi:hypothetical protein